MKELQKYYAIDVSDKYGPMRRPVYDASEADAAFAEMRREHAQELGDAERDLLSTCGERIAALKRGHAEEIERLKESAKYAWNEDTKIIESLRLQAGRYEKLRSKSMSLFQWPTAEFDSFVDQLPVSGEASADVQARRTE